MLRSGVKRLLPKIDKAGDPGRAIVFANGHPSEKISEFINLRLHDHVHNLSSHFKHTSKFLGRHDAQAPFPPDTLLVSINAIFLYTNIPHHDDMQACGAVWEERKVKDPSTPILVKVLTLILKCNNFEFNGKHYVEVQCTPKGTKTAPAYANISWDVARDSC